MKNNIIKTVFLLGILTASCGCLGALLSIDNKTGIPFIVTIIKGDGDSKEIRIPKTPNITIGHIGATAKENVDRIIDIKFVNDWQTWMQWKSLPRFTDVARLELDRVLAKLKEKAPTKANHEFILKIGLDRNNELTFSVNVVGEWVAV